MSNTEQIVRQVIDTLSDAVSEFVLLVVVLREQNATMPENLPRSSQGVNETAKKLGLIARKLASTDYKDFAEIATEINTAADSLDSATQVMANSVSVLSASSDRKTGWDSLVDACRVLSGKTIRLLQIVYGAPLKRLKINADRLLDNLNKMEPYPKGLKDQKAQQKLLDEIKPLTDKALRLEKHLNDRAKATESPQARQQLQDAAADTHKAAQDLVDAVNKAINDPDHADIKKPLDALRDAVEKGRDIGEKTAPPAPKGPLDTIKPAPGGGGPTAIPPPPPPGPKTLHDAVKQAKDTARAIPDVVAKEPQNYPEAQDKLKDEVEQIRKKVNADPEQWKKDVETPLANQIKAARDVARTPNPPPQAKKALQDSTDQLAKALDDVEAKHSPHTHEGPHPAKTAPPPTPGAPVAKASKPGEKARTVDPQTKKKATQIFKLVVPPDFEKLITDPEKKEKYEQAKLKDNLQALRADVKEHKPKHAVPRTKQAVAAAHDLAKALKDDAARPDHTPEERQALNDAADHIEKAIPELQNAVVAALKDPQNPEAAVNVDDKIKKMNRAAERAVPKPGPHGKVPKQEWKEAKEDMQKAIEAIKKGNPAAAQKAIDRAADKAVDKIIKPNPGRGLLDRDPAAAPSDELQKLWDRFKNAGARGDPDEMDKLIPEIEDAFKRYDEVPKAAADRFNDAVDDLVDAVRRGDPHPPVQDVKDEFDKFANDTQKDPSPEIRSAAAHATDDVAPLLDDLVRKAQEAAKRPNDKRAQQAVEAAAQAVKQPMKQFKDRIQPLDNDFKKAKEDMKKAADAVRKGDKPAAEAVIKQLDDKPTGRHFTPDQRGAGVPPPPPAHEPSDDLEKLFDQFKDAADRGDAKAMDKIIPQMEKAYQPVKDRPVDAAKAVKDALDDVVDALKRGDDVVPVQELKDAFDRLVDEARDDPSPEVRDEAQKLVDAIQPELDDFIKKAEGPKTSPAQAAAQAERAAPAIKKPLEAFKEKMKPLDDAFHKNQDEMKKAADAVRRGDKPAAKRIIDNIADKPFGRNFTPQKGRGIPPPQPDGPSDELQRLFDKFRKAGNRGDPNKMEELIPEMEKQYNKMADKPKQAADRLKNAIDDVVDAAKAGRTDPPLRDLKEALDRFVDDTRNDPSPEVRELGHKAVEELRPLVAELVKASEEAAKNPKDPKKAAAVEMAAQKAMKPVEAFKQGLKPLDDAFNKNKEEMKKAAAAVRRKDPNAKHAIEKIAEKPFGRTIAPIRGRDPLLSDDPEVDEIKKLFEQFGKDADKGNAKAMEDAIPKMDRAYQKIAEKPKNAADKLKAAVDDVAKAVKTGSDPHPSIDRLKDAYDDFVKDVQKDPSPEVRDAGAKAADEAFPAIADLIKKAEEAAKNPQDKKKAQEVEVAAQQAKKPIDAFKEKLKPLDNAWNKNKEEMKKAADEVKKGNKPAAKKIIDQLADKPVGRNFTPGKGRGVPPDSSTGPSDELQNLWNKFKKAANKGDPGAMEKLVPELDKAFDKHDKATNATPVAAADKIEKAIDDVLGALDNNEPLPVKKIKEALDEFTQAANDPTYDPHVAKEAKKAEEEFVPEFKDFLKKAQAAMANPGDREKAKAVEKAAPKLKKPITAFKAAVAPDDVTVNDDHANAVKEAIADLQDAIQENKPPKIQKAVDNVKAKLADYGDNAHEIAKHLDDPGKSNYVDRKAAEVDDLLKEIDDFNPLTDAIQILNAVECAPELLDDISCHIGSDAADDAVEGAARAANLTAFLDSVDEDDLDLGDLLGCASDLADLMRGMVGETTAVAEAIGTSADNLSDSTRAALGINSLIRELEGDLSLEDVQELSQKVSELRSSEVREPTGPPLVPLSEATNFNDVAAAVAYNIKQRCQQQNDSFSKTGANVAVELSNLSISARSGDKQQLLLSAKAASAHIAALSKEVAALAAKIPGKTAQEHDIQDNLYRASQGLANYGTQLKILTSVKAASIEESKDTDESLSTITTDLGDIISNVLTSMTLANTIILKGK